MLTVKFGWRTLIPVRAIPYLTGGTFDAGAVASLFFHPDRYAGNEFSHRTSAIRILPDNSFANVALGEFGSAYYHFRDKHRRLVELKHIRRLPAGVFVWRRSFKILYDFLAKQDSLNYAMDLGDHPAGSFAWMEDLQLTAKQHSVVWQAGGGSPNRAVDAATPMVSREGPGSTLYNLPSRPTAKSMRLEEWDHDAALQKIAERLVAPYQEQKKRFPPLLKLAAQIKNDVEFDQRLAELKLPTIARRIRATWKVSKVAPD